MGTVLTGIMILRLKAILVFHASRMDVMPSSTLTRLELSMLLEYMGLKTLIVCGLAVRFSA